MNFCQISRLLGFLCVALSFRLCAEEAVACTLMQENNAWPLLVTHMAADGTKIQDQGIGPLLHSRALPGGAQVKGFRPFLLDRTEKGGTRREVDVLYPLFLYRSDQGRWAWSILNLINRRSIGPSSEDSKTGAFDFWPLYFSKQTGKPESSYRALFPLSGVVKHRLGNDRMEWALFPLYGRFQTGDKVVHTVPWPFVRTIEGGGHRGWALWPLAGWQEQTGKSRSQFYLWPLIYKNESKLDQPEPSRSLGVLPFYSIDRSAEAVSETYVWPFFGYTDQRAPFPYHETRWLWPLFVQGRGTERYRNRWAPFYSHSIIKGGDKTWVLWPLFRRQSWNDNGLDHTKTQFLFFLYWSLHQQRSGHPEVAPAEKFHLWPFVSAWDNGAGRRQTQLLSPFEVFFPHNEAVRLNWSPLFALYQFDQRKPGHTRHSLLWNAIASESCKDTGELSFHLGPLVSYQKSTGSGRVSLLCGLFGFQRVAGQSRWRPFFLHFSKRAPAPAKQP